MCHKMGSEKWWDEGDSNKSIRELRMMGGCCDVSRSTRKSKADVVLYLTL